jgi:hypothetical protein
MTLRMQPQRVQRIGAKHGARKVRMAYTLI